MRIRSIKPEFYVSESVGRLTREARLLFIGLWSFADDSGRGRGALPAISGALYPYDADALKLLPKWFAELEAEGMVRRYKCEDGNTYYDIPKWLNHQRIEKPSKSKFPEFTEYSRNTPGMVGDGSRLDQGSGSRDQGAMEQGAEEGDVASAAPSKKRAKGNDPEAASVLSHLNAATGRAYQPTEATLREIRIRITEVNGDIAGIIKMIDRQKSLWGGDAKMAEYLRPSTLFRQSKFHDYYAAKDCPTFPAPNGHHRSPQQSLRNTLIAGSDEWDAQAAYDIANRPEGFGVPWAQQDASSAVPATARPGMEA